MIQRAIFLFFITFLMACGAKRDPNLTYFDKPEDYNDYIITEQMAVFEVFDEFISLIETGTIDETNNLLNKVHTRAKEASDKMSKLADYKENTEFRESGRALFDFYVTQCKTDLKEMVDLFAKDTLMTEADHQRIDEIANAFDKKEAEYNQILITTQEAFARKFHLELVDDK